MNKKINSYPLELVRTVMNIGNINHISYLTIYRPRGIIKQVKYILKSTLKIRKLIPKFGTALLVSEFLEMSLQIFSFSNSIIFRLITEMIYT